MSFPAQPNQSLIDGMRCLMALASLEEPVSGRELARRLGFESTRTHRLLKTLGGLGLARQDGKQRYAVGPGIHALSALSLRASGLSRIALPALLTLSDTGHRMALGTLWQGQVAYLFHGLGEIGGIGHPDLRDARKSSIGLVLTARRPEGEWVGWEGQVDALREARAKAYAYRVFTGRPREASVAVALDDGNAIALAGAIRRRDLPPLLKRLRAVALDIQTQMNRENRT